ncbi:MAG: type II secretion system minor pseudopilin GspJ [Xanthomonadales bacterium]|nr:type II secretion system minor pseudopilin GspJ [Xanthomonadales bacterium]
MRTRRQSGFTLLELLVAVALFAVVVVLAYGGLDQIARQGSDLEAESERLADVQRAVDRLVSDLRAAAPRPVRDASVGRLPPLSGDPQQIEFTRAGYGNRLAAPRAELERVGYRLEGDNLQRLHYAALDRSSPLPLRRDALLDGVEALRFAYRDAAGRTLSAWPESRQADDRLPAAVVVHLQLDDYGEIERLVELPQGGAQP